MPVCRRCGSVIALARFVPASPAPALGAGVSPEEALDSSPAAGQVRGPADLTVPTPQQLLQEALTQHCTVPALTLETTKPQLRLDTSLRCGPSLQSGATNTTLTTIAWVSFSLTLCSSCQMPHCSSVYRYIYIFMYIKKKKKPCNCTCGILNC